MARAPRQNALRTLSPVVLPYKRVPRWDGEDAHAMPKLIVTLSVVAFAALGCAGSTEAGSSGAPPAPSGGSGSTYDPCASKACGALCLLCAPNAAACQETDEPKRCNADGRCVDGAVECK